MALKISIATRTDSEDWNRLVRERSGTVFHTWEWLELFAGKTPLANRSLLIRDGDRPIGALPILVARRMGVRFGYSVPLGVAGLLAEEQRALGEDPEFRAAVAAEADWLQVTNLVPGEAYRPVPVAIVDLAPPEGEIFDRFHKTVRYEIRRAESAKLTICEAETPQDLAHVWALYERTMHRKGSGGSIWPALLRGLGSLPGSNRRAILAWRDGEPVGANVCLREGAEAFYFAEGSDERFRSLHANRLLLWHNIRWAKGQGSLRMHLGGGASTSSSDTLLLYKLKYGKPGEWHRSQRALSFRGLAAFQAYRVLSDDARRWIRARLFG